MNELDLSYAAGLFDGEGCITTKWPKRQQLAVELKMVSKPTVEKFARAVGGTCVTGYERRHGRFKQWQCRLYDSNAVAALEAMLPYLCEKAEQARLAIAFKAASTDDERTALNDKLKEQKLRCY